MSESPLDNAEIIGRVHAHYPDAAVEIEGEGCDLSLNILSDGFAGMPLMRRQQSILALFADDLAAGRLHALSVKARTRAEIANVSSNLVQLEL